MVLHTTLGDREIWCHLKSRSLVLAGNRKLKIYGHLNCCAGKRMKKENRIFFTNTDEPKQFGYRPCHHCMPGEYKKWKAYAAV